jgi:diphthamide biosynthesis protein 2
LGGDYAIEYERDENGKIRGAAMEEGRAGVARGYAVAEDKEG